MMKNQTRKVKIFRALLKRDVRTLSKMVTFAQIEWGGAKRKTLVDPKNGTKPMWNQILEIPINSPTSNFVIAVYDDGSFGEEVIGKGNFNIYENEEEDREEAIDLMFQGKVVGKVHIKVMAKNKPIVIEYPQISSPAKSIQQKERKIFENTGANLLNNNTISSPKAGTVFDYLSSPLSQPGSGNPYTPPQLVQPSYGYGFPQASTSMGYQGPPLPMNIQPPTSMSYQQMPMRYQAPMYANMNQPQFQVPGVNGYYMGQNRNQNVGYVNKNQVINRSSTNQMQTSSLQDLLNFF